MAKNRLLTLLAALLLLAGAAFPPARALEGAATELPDLAAPGTAYDAAPAVPPEPSPAPRPGPHEGVFQGGDLPLEITPQSEGAVWRGGEGLSARSSVAQLTVAYLECDQGVMDTGRASRWTIRVEGGSGGYLYKLGFYYRASDPPFGASYSYVAEYGFTTSNQFTFTPKNSGYYLVTAYVKDTAGQQLVWQSDVQWASPAGDASNPATVAGKVEYLKNQCLARASTPYARAKWMHDWLVNNARYDLTYTYFAADGVLLRGTGVCNSYAQAYYLLMKAVGIPVVKVSNSEHGWNMIQLDGFWYHVDVTWDDPVPDGTLRHTYFLRSDAAMRADHGTWTKETGNAPDSPYDWGKAPEGGATPPPQATYPEPRITEAAAVGGTAIRLRWTPVAGASGYEVWRSTSRTGQYTLAKAVSGTEFTNTYLKAGTLYYYKVRSYAGSGAGKQYGDFGPVAAAIPLAKPGVPAASSPAKGQIKLTWKAVPGAAAYEVWRSASAGGAYTRVYKGQSLTFTNKSLKSGSVYYYKVRAFKAVGTQLFYSPFSGYRSVKSK